MDYSLISLFLFSVCLLCSKTVSSNEQKKNCDFDQNELIKNRQPHREDNTFYYECQPNDVLMEKHCSDGLIFDKDSLVSFADQR